jgi:S1-C subfamily serine protease
MKKRLAILVLGGVLAGCNTTPVLNVPTSTFVKPERSLQQGESSAGFALARLVSDINRGDQIFAFPAQPPTKGSLCNQRYGSDSTVSYAGGSRYLGDWSSELGKVFHETLTRLNFKVAGDPADMFNQRESVKSAEYLIGGRLVKMKGNFCHEHHWWDGRPLDTFSGELYVEFEWSILNTLTKDIVFKERVDGYYKQSEPIKNGIPVTFENAFISAVEKLGANPALMKLAKGEKLPLPASQQAVGTDIVRLIANGKRNTKFDIGSVGGSVVTIRIGQGHGTGFFVGKEGYLLTNAHVVGIASRVQVKTSIGLEVPADVVAVNRERDVALLRAQIAFPSPPFIRTTIPNVATEVFVVGSPMKESLGNTVTRGIVSAIRTDSASGLRFIQSDAAISPGNSGGPLFDQEGNVIGISVAKYSGGGAEGLGLFIPIADAIEALSIKVAP